MPSRESLENTVHMNQKKLVLECTWCMLNVAIRTNDDVIIQIAVAVHSESDFDLQTQPLFVVCKTCSVNTA